MGAATSFLTAGPVYTPDYTSSHSSFTFGQAVPGSRGGTTTSVQFGVTPYKGYTAAGARSVMSQGQLQAAVEQYLLFFSSPFISGCFGDCYEEKMDKLFQLGIVPVSMEEFEKKQPTNSAIVKVASEVMKKVGGGKTKSRRKGRGAKRSKRTLNKSGKRV